MLLGNLVRLLQGRGVGVSRYVVKVRSLLQKVNPLIRHRFEFGFSQCEFRQFNKVEFQVLQVVSHVLRVENEMPRQGLFMVKQCEVQDAQENDGFQLMVLFSPFELLTVGFAAVVKRTFGKR